MASRKSLPISEPWCATLQKEDTELDRPEVLPDLTCHNFINAFKAGGELRNTLAKTFLTQGIPHGKID